MTYNFKLDALEMDGTRFLVEPTGGTFSLAARRASRHTAGFRHGTVDREDYYGEKYLRLGISIFATDENGERTSSPLSHLTENFWDLAAVLRKRTPIDARLLLPGDAGSSGDDITLQAYVRSDQEVMLTDDAKPLVWKVIVELAFPWPFWHELPQIQLAAAGSHEIVTGPAVIADPVFVFSGDGVLTDDLGLGHEIEIAGSTSAVTVDVGKREVYQSGALRMDLLRLGDNSPEHWVEWPAHTTVNVSSTVNVAVNYHVAYP